MGEELQCPELFRITAAVRPHLTIGGISISQGLLDADQCLFILQDISPSNRALIINCTLFNHQPLNHPNAHEHRNTANDQPSQAIYLSTDYQPNDSSFVARKKLVSSACQSQSSVPESCYTVPSMIHPIHASLFDVLLCHRIAKRVNE